MESSCNEDRASSNTEAGVIDLTAWAAAAYDAVAEVTSGALHLSCEHAGEGPKTSVTAFVGLKTGETSLQIGIGADEAGAEKLTRALLLMEEDEGVEAEDISDAMGEIANMVAGGIKSRLVTAETSLAIGLPIFVSGEIDDPNQIVLHTDWITAGDIQVCVMIRQQRAD